MLPSTSSLLRLQGLASRKLFRGFLQPWDKQAAGTAREHEHVAKLGRRFHPLDIHDRRG